MTYKDISQKVLKTIEEKKIKPKPRWNFVAKNYVVWSLGILSVIIGSFATAVIIFMIKDNDWLIYQNLDCSLIKFIIFTLPYFWFIFFALFIIAAHFNIKHTKKGYRYKLPTVILTVVIISLILGFLFYNIGLGQAIDHAMQAKLPFYQKVMMHRQKIWRNIDQGFLAGTIILVETREKFRIEDLAKQEWQIDASQARIAPRLKIVTGEQLKMVGKKLPDFYFEAKLIGPYFQEPKGWFKHRLPLPPQHINYLNCERNNCSMRNN